MWLFYFQIFTQRRFFLFEWTRITSNNFRLLCWSFLNSFVGTTFEPWVFCAFYWGFFNCDSSIVNLLRVLIFIVIYHTVTLVEATIDNFQLSRLGMIWTFTDDTILDNAFSIIMKFFFLRIFNGILSFLIWLKLKFTSTRSQIYMMRILLWCKLYFLCFGFSF